MKRDWFENARHCGFVLMVLLLSSGSLQAGSIWAKRTAAAKPMYADDKANQIGDVLTIIISEIHKVDNKVKQDLSRTSDRNFEVGGDDISIGHVLPSVSKVKVDVDSSKSLSGKSDYKDERKIEDRITVVVMDIHPNGNLVVMGTRTRELNGDTQTIQVSGIVRPRDISFDNTIRSEQVANFQMIAVNDGVTKDFTKPGWLGKFLDKIWPF
ncbi:MAG TPA: flagellar basal body L-ring protein FlgH [Anaerohalosphaeraceae bacterium]|nr:flagellar basal body L-ring protein FlgH [Anaerohalosphaeraceae bacterium]HOL87673.1 flagellar basal body L-ring protein FlgH [Anaerohalosphaeraceae bacterium]HPP55819.1 flagellar basal body L-ring protein FlgH [Anaerohalosphaeraceae bacterium]